MSGKFVSAGHRNQHAKRVRYPTIGAQLSALRTHSSQGHPPSLRYRVAVRKHSYNLKSVAAARSTELRHPPLQKLRTVSELSALKMSLEALGHGASYRDCRR